MSFDMCYYIKITHIKRRGREDLVEGEKSQVGIIESDYETWADVHSYHGKLYCVYTQTIDLEEVSGESRI